MFAALAVILIVAWLLGFVVFNVAGGLIHLLLVVAVISFIWQLVAGRRTRTPTV
ncbi:MAG: lmo0937 family membrane protein [Gemmatimonadales bacterium]